VTHKTPKILILERQSNRTEIFRTERKTDSYSKRSEQKGINLIFGKVEAKGVYSENPIFGVGEI
jgi:hypothetical protein